jgi:LPXTG-motif cell wall-anchored protein
LDDLEHPEAFYYKIHDVAKAHKPVVIGAVAVLLAGLVLVRRRQAAAKSY